MGRRQPPLAEVLLPDRNAGLDARWLKADRIGAAGDEVWAYDVVSSTWQPRRVVQTFSSQYDGMMFYLRLDGERITTTARHPFWVVRGERLKERLSLEHLPHVPDGATQEGAWIDACDLKEGDELLLQDGRIVHVQSLATVG